ncbi:hypothetical protein ES703_22879 [subsurface metagenome]
MTAIKYRFSLPLFILQALVLLLPAAAQDRAPGAAALIIYHEGEDFEIRSSSGNPVEVTEILGHELYEGDIILAGEDTFIEIQLIPTQNVIKIAENTDFQLHRSRDARESTFQMLYGSVRARIQKLSADERFRIHGPVAVAGARGTDFGMNVQVPQGEAEREAVTDVYCFEGTVEVEPRFEIVGLTPGEAILLSQDEMITLSLAAPGEALQKRPIEEKIRAYWLEHEFKGELIPPEDFAIATKKFPLIWELFLRQKRANLAGCIFLSLGFIFEATGLAAYAGGDRMSDPAKSGTMRNVGTALAASGVFFLSASIVSFIRAGRVHREINKPGFQGF